MIVIVGAAGRAAHSKHNLKPIQSTAGCKSGNNAPPCPQSADRLAQLYVFISNNNKLLLIKIPFACVMFSLDYTFPLRTDSDETFYDASNDVQIFETEVHDFVVLYVVPGMS